MAMERGLVRLPSPVSEVILLINYLYYASIYIVEQYLFKQ